MSRVTEEESRGLNTSLAECSKMLGQALQDASGWRATAKEYEDQIEDLARIMTVTALRELASEADRIAHIAQTSWDDLDPAEMDEWRDSTLAAVHRAEATVGEWLREKATVILAARTSTATTATAFPAAAFRHDDGAICLYNAASGTWYANDDGRMLLSPRPVCERDHPTADTEESESA